MTHICRVSPPTPSYGFPGIPPKAYTTGALSVQHAVLRFPVYSWQTDMDVLIWIRIPLLTKTRRKKVSQTRYRTKAKILGKMKKKRVEKSFGDQIANESENLGKIKKKMRTYLIPAVFLAV